jgi:hypothetical protein
VAKTLGPRSPPGLREETGLHRLDEDSVRVVSETLQVDAAGACLFSYLLKVEPDGFSDALCRTYAPMLPAHRTVSHLRIEYPTLFRKPLQFIVITVMGVIIGTFPDTYGVFCMTVNG